MRRGRSTLTCCCSAIWSWPPSGSHCRTGRSPLAASCSSRCWSSIRTCVFPTAPNYAARSRTSARVSGSAGSAPEGLEPLGRKHRRKLPGELGNEPHRELARRALLDRRPQIVEGHRQPEGGGDLEVGGVRLVSAHDAVLDPAVDPIEVTRQRREVGPDVLVAGL